MRRTSSFAVLTFAALTVLAACHPRHEGERGEGRHGGRLRAVCADDISKYCKNEDRPRRCLRDNMEKLSAACKEAVESGRGGGRRNRDNGSSNDDD